jgi:uncharacterized membrane protein HdeD (DUF308 family)
VLNPITVNQLDHDAAEAASKAWPILVISGIVSIVAGVLILSIQWTVSDLALFVSILFIVRGVFTGLTRPLDGSGRAWNLFIGGLEILVGIAFVAWPGVTLLTLAIFIGAWVLVSGIFNIIGAIANRDVSLWWLFLIVGIIEVVLGLALLDRPELTLALAIAVAGIWAVVAGALQIAAGIELKNLPAKLAKG